MKRKVFAVNWLCMLCVWATAQDAKHYTWPSSGLQDTIRVPVDTSHNDILIRALNLSGNKKTKQNIIEREFAIQEGKMYNPRDLFKRIRLTREQLMNTALFVTVEITIDTLLRDEVDINIVVRERWFLIPVPYFKIVDRNWNVWINDYKASLDRVEFGAKVTHNNMTGRNDKFNVYLIGGYSQQVSFNYARPFFDKKLRQGYTGGFQLSRTREVNVSTDSNRQQFYSLPDFARNFMKAEIGYTYRKGSLMRSSLRVSYNKDKMDSAIIAQNPNMFGQGRTQAEFVDVLANYQFLNVDYIPYPLRGWMVDFYALKRISGTIPMMQIGGRMQSAWKFAHKSYINFQGAFAVTFSEEVPFYNSRMLGYRSLYMQGLEYYVADGTWAAMLRTTLRREVLSFTIKNAFRSKSHSVIPFSFFIKTYGNLGYAYSRDPGNNFMNNQLLRTAGFGLDIKTVYDVVFKLEYSFNQFGERGFFIHSATDF